MEMNSIKKCELAFEISCGLGEGPVWDSGKKRIFWVDIAKCEIHWWYPGSGTHEKCVLGHPVSAMTLTITGGVLAALKTCLADIDIESGTAESVLILEDDLSDNRMNDGKCDPSGRFWVGTMSMSGKPRAGSLYMIDRDMGVSVKITDVGISNGLTWSPDSATFYYIDTNTNQVVAYDYDDATADITNKRTVVRIPEKDGNPDGMTIDTEGMLWIALWDGWKIGRWDPGSGRLISEISTPVARPTSCVFGGSDMQDLYITSARHGLSGKALRSQPLAGSLFVLKDSGYQGLPGNAFAGNYGKGSPYSDIDQ